MDGYSGRLCYMSKKGGGEQSKASLIGLPINVGNKPLSVL